MWRRPSIFADVSIRELGNFDCDILVVTEVTILIPLPLIIL
jgi:hypothetical protein